MKKETEINEQAIKRYASKQLALTMFELEFENMKQSKCSIASTRVTNAAFRYGFINSHYLDYKGVETIMKLLA